MFIPKNVYMEPESDLGYLIVYTAGEIIMHFQSGLKDYFGWPAPVKPIKSQTFNSLKK